jgi:integrase
MLVKLIITRDKTSRKKVEGEDKYVKRWLDSCTKSDTRISYASAFRLYLQYTGMGAEELLKEAQADLSKDVLEREEIVKSRLLGFHEWLKTEAPRTQSGGKGVRKVIGKGYLATSAHNYFSGIRSFYTHYGFSVKLAGKSKIGKPAVTYTRHLYNNKEVKRLCDLARSPRDRAIVLLMFQSGLDVSTICQLIYDRVADSLASGEYPLKISTMREKENVKFFTLVGREGIEALKTYIGDMEAKGVVYSPATPLFLKELYRKDESGKIIPVALDTNNVSEIMKDLTLRAGFSNGGGFNKYGAHALRESFSSIAHKNKVPRSMVDLWLGHEIGDLEEAYERSQYEDVVAQYLAIEPLLSVTGVSDKLKASEKEISDLQKEVAELSKALNLTQVWKEEAERKLKAIESQNTQTSELVEDTIRGFQMFLEAGALTPTNEDTKKLLKDLFSKVDQSKYPEN